MSLVGSIEDARQEHVEELIRLSDAMVDELERLNLAGVARVAYEWRERLAFLFAAVPFAYTPRLRAHPSPTEVLDVLFDLQAPLLDLRRQRSLGPSTWIDSACRAS